MRRRIIKELYRSAVMLFDRGYHYSSFVLAYHCLNEYVKGGGELVDRDTVTRFRKLYYDTLNGEKVNEKDLRELLSSLSDIIESEEEGEVVINVELIDVLLGVGLLAIILSFFMKVDILWIDAVRIPALSLIAVTIIKRLLITKAQVKE